MGNPFTNPNRERPVENIGSSLRNKGGHGSGTEKRHSVAEYLLKLKDILNILPEESKRRIGNQVERIKGNPSEVIDIIRREIEAEQVIVDYLNNGGISTEQALKELEDLLPKKTTIQ